MIEVNGVETAAPVEFLILPNLPFDLILGLKFLQKSSAVLVFGPAQNEIRIGGTQFSSIDPV